MSGKDDNDDDDDGKIQRILWFTAVLTVLKAHPIKSTAEQTKKEKKIHKRVATIFKRWKWMEWPGGGSEENLKIYDLQ